MTPFDTTKPISYIQYSIKDQTAESLFTGSLFVSLGDVSSGPSQAEVLTTGGGTYGTTSKYVDFFRDDVKRAYWARKEAENIPFVRQTGSPWDFPFDSTTIDFDTTFKPALPLRGLIIRNFNPSFYLVCDPPWFKVTSPDSVHLHFRMRRNPLVQLMAVVIFGTAALFALIIPFSVKRDSLPMAVASFFFSVWSTRGILSSEMKVFPTLFDLGILFLCVLILLLIGLQILRWWIKSPGPGLI
jgi:hypothetical protein